MANKKGEGVRGVLGDLVSKERGRQERPPAMVDQAAPSLAAESVAEAAPTAESTPSPAPIRQAVASARKAIRIKGRPRGRKDELTDVKRERTKVTLSIEEALREQFYLLAHAEMIQPGEYVERALRYYMKHHAK